MNASDESVETQIGARVRGLRLARGWSLAEVGERLGRELDAPWSPQAVWQAEMGKRSFRAAHMVALSRVFGCSVDDLFTSVADQINPHQPEVRVVRTCAECGEPWPCVDAA